MYYTHTRLSCATLAPSRFLFHGDKKRDLPRVFVNARTSTINILSFVAYNAFCFCPFNRHIESNYFRFLKTCYTLFADCF